MSVESMMNLLSEKDEYGPYKDNIFIRSYIAIGETIRSETVYHYRWYIVRKLDGYYSDENTKAHEYLHKNFLWKAVCGLEAMWDTVEEAEVHLIKYYDWTEFITEDEMEI